MKRRFTCAVVPFLLGSLAAGCNPDGAVADPVATGTGQSAATPTPSASASVAAGGARSVSEVTDIFLFEYSYPQAAGEIPELGAWMDRRLERGRTSLASDAAQGQEDARDDGFPFNKYSSSVAWEVVADLPEWISLSAQISSYSGGAHPNYGFDTIVWDKSRDVALEPIAFFESPAALDRALGEELCEALNAERAKRRGEPVEEGSDDTFDACVKPDETNLLLGSSNGRVFDRVGIQIAPYIAGPYAEGAYEFTFDVTPEILETVREKYREAFAARN